MTEPTWAIALIEPNLDAIAHQAFQRHGFRSICLTYRKQLTGHNRPHWRKRADCITLPLFPGYIFVDLGELWPRPSQIRGYCGLIDGGRKRLPSEIIECWQQRCVAGDFDDKPTTISGVIRNRFRHATDPDDRRKLLEQRFAAMIAEQYAEAS